MSDSSGEQGDKIYVVAFKDDKGHEFIKASFARLDSEDNAYIFEDAKGQFVATVPAGNVRYIKLRD